MVELNKLTLRELFNVSTEKFANRPAMGFVDKEPLTYSGLREKVLSVTQFLKEEGVVPGDRVAILGENSPNWSISYFAITIMGAVGVPIMTEFTEVEVHHVLRHSDSKAIFISKKYYDKIVGSEFEKLNTVILLDDFSILPRDGGFDFLTETVRSGKKEFAKVKFAAMKLAGVVKEEINEDDLALIYYTSGTTGHSKGVMLTHKNIVYDVIISSRIAGVGERDRLLSILPLYHTIESTLGMAVVVGNGAQVVYLAKPPTASILLPALKKVKPTVIIGVPLIIEKIYKNKILPQFKGKAVVRNLYKLSAVRKKLHKIAGKKLMETFGGELKMMCIGGAPLNPEVENFLREAHFPFAVGYGLTETSPLVTGTDNTKTRWQSCGKALDGVEIKIQNPDPQTGEGDILLRAPNVMKGYFKDPEKTEEVLSPDGWFKTGDLGYVDEEGYVFIKGRSKNMILGPNGKNVYPEEIEAVLQTFDCVVESIVFERDGQIMAKVHLDYEVLDKLYEIEKFNEPEARKKVEAILQRILREVNTRISKHSRINKIIEQLEPFEKTPTHKIKRYLYL